jgi:uncharacterized protein
MRVVIVFAAIFSASEHAQGRSFFEIVQAGSPSSVKDAIKAGADVNAHDPDNGMTPLMRAAAFNRNPKVIELLVKAGAKVNATDHHGMTALMYAALNNQNTQIVAALLHAGADPKAKDDRGNTASDYSEENASFGETGG